MTNTLSARTVATILARAERDVQTDSGCDCPECLVRYAYYEVMDSAKRAIINASSPGPLTVKLQKHLFPKG